MDQEILEKEILKYFPFSKSEIDEIYNKFTLIKLKKGSFFNEKDTYLGIVIDGCLKFFYDKDHEIDVIIDFQMSGQWTGDLESFLKKEKSKFMIQALCDTTVLAISQEDYTELENKSLKLKQLSVKITESIFLKTFERLISRMSNTAEENYLMLKKEKKQIFHLIKKTDLAAYLKVNLFTLYKIIHHTG